MIYFKDDIVEVLNAQNPFGYLNYPNGDIPNVKNYIGQRLRVTQGVFRDRVCVDLLKGRDGLYPNIAQNQIRLYHRPLKNHIRWVWYKIKSYANNR